VIWIARVRKRNVLKWVGVVLKVSGAYVGIAGVVVKYWVFTIINLVQRKIPALPRGGLKQSVHARKHL
jgi:hypothetical protein